MLSQTRRQEAEVSATPPNSAAATPLLVPDLLLDFNELERLLLKEIARRSWLDGFLLAAGMNQLLEDHLHRDLVALEATARTVAQVAGGLGRMLSAVLRLIRAAGLAARDALPAERRLVRWQADLNRVVLALAGASQSDGEGGLPDRRAEVEWLLRQAPPFPHGLQSAIVRLPTCFRSLDQRPGDLKQIVRGFRAAHPDRDRPILVLGLRTSGSYLAPLYAHFLERDGYTHVTAMTLRPGHRLLRHEMARISDNRERRGLILMTDDPPKTGSSLLRTARSLERIGCPSSSIVLLLPLLAEAASLPDSLRGYEAFVLPWKLWEIHEALKPTRLTRTMAQMLEGRTVSTYSDAGETSLSVAGVVAVEPIELGRRFDLKAGSPVRRHIQSLFRVHVRGEGGAPDASCLVYSKGVGLGYFGAHSIAVAETLNGFVPELYGVADGVLFRKWIPESKKVTAGSPRFGLAQAVAEYVDARHRGLRTTDDKSLRTAGLNPIWQRIADLLGTGFGRQRVLFRPVLHATAKRILEVREPSVIDGSTTLSQWFEQPDGKRPLKVDYDERAFSNQDTVIDQLYSYDPLFDLAVAAADHELEVDSEDEDDGFSRRLAAAYESTSESRIPRERWFLYQVLHLSSYRRFVQSLHAEISAGAMTARGIEDLTAADVREVADHVALAAARVDQRYLAETLLGDAASPSSGALCAIDIDGVLETGSIGHSSATPVGVDAMRRLMNHGHRPVLVSGRSLGEVMDRCRSFRLPGGVAEYGAVLFDNTSGRVVDMLEPDEQARLDAVRKRLDATPGAHVHRGYRRIVRASDVTGGDRQPLPDDLIDELTEGGSIVAVRGLAQTDLVPARIDKGLGVRALTGILSGGNPGAGTALAFAIGDSQWDLPMLALASAAFAPANADAAVQASGARILTRSHQAGLSDAVSEFLGHAPGRCRMCRGPQLGPDAKLLMTALGAGRAGRMKKVALGLQLAALQVTRR